MNDFLIYALKVGAIQLLFLIVYELLLRKETFFQWNRMYLLGSLIVSLFLPVVKMNFSQEMILSTYTYTLEEVVIGNVNSSMETLKTYQSFDWLLGIYLLGVSIFISIFLFRLDQILKIVRNSRKTKVNGITIYLMKNTKQAFTFLGAICIGEEAVREECILHHERVHQRKWHSLDIVFTEILRIIFWFNPLLWIYRKRLSELHEFEADSESVCLHKKAYYKSIINQVFDVDEFVLASNMFTRSLLKQRLVMLRKNKSTKKMLLKYATVLPMLCLAFVLGGTYSSAQEKKVTVPITEVDEKPYFEECANVSKEESVMYKCFKEQIDKHIVENLQYPKEALDKGIEGRVFVLFLIDEEGNVEAQNVRGRDKSLEKEAKRLIESLPKLHPAKLKGKPVATTFAYPVVFKLSTSSESPESSVPVYDATFERIKKE